MLDKKKLNFNDSIFIYKKLLLCTSFSSQLKKNKKKRKKVYFFYNYFMKVEFIVATH